MNGALDEESQIQIMEHLTIAGGSCVLGGRMLTVIGMEVAVMDIAPCCIFNTCYRSQLATHKIRLILHMTHILYILFNRGQRGTGISPVSCT